MAKEGPSAHLAALRDLGPALSEAAPPGAALRSERCGASAARRAPPPLTRSRFPPFVAPPPLSAAGEPGALVRL